ncbi:RloB family protein [Acerihabitans sp. TG2]|uniref:RloB family protein n=1 Tax=Acerihabitans sp. TG2 TaxID=3096008 RepID=UPI002B228E57|nr:RloB family protein [Acerihabitans sp. TG2]MEA9390412.1 RloB family protein [Acerihabitans sp. TG2]
MWLKSIKRGRSCKKLYKESVVAYAPYDKVYCVIDKDAHVDYFKALDIIYRANPKNIFFIINSIPCFEYWLLLHYKYSTKNYENLPNNSSGKQIIHELKKYIPDYKKATKGLFRKLNDKVDAAIANSLRAKNAAFNHGTDNPSTLIHELIIILRKMKK